MEETPAYEGEYRLPRDGWDAAFLAMAESGDDELLDEPLPTEFGRTQWRW